VVAFDMTAGDEWAVEELYDSACWESSCIEEKVFSCMLPAGASSWEVSEAFDAGTGAQVPWLPLLVEEHVDEGVVGGASCDECSDGFGGRQMER
jgi:hypothetical protein